MISGRSKRFSIAILDMVTVFGTGLPSRESKAPTTSRRPESLESRSPNQSPPGVPRLPSQQFSCQLGFPWPGRRHEWTWGVRHRDAWTSSPKECIPRLVSTPKITAIYAYARYENSKCTYKIDKRLIVVSCSRALKHNVLKKESVLLQRYCLSSNLSLSVAGRLFGYLLPPSLPLSHRCGSIVALYESQILDSLAPNCAPGAGFSAHALWCPAISRTCLLVKCG